MIHLVANEELELKYRENFGAWTYHIQIPGTKDLKGQWGSTKVSGTLDDYKLDKHNLAPRTDEDYLISINKEIRKSLNKKPGDRILVNLWLEIY
ncbi:DUF1905 domain-containing protein [Jeotgalibaca sp. A127]|uniref:DUF1905 domain-containing protein n=1 Tax=Jeotgalibaca sp. A127 TaxID=3457324 RepID=UPI003FD5DC26